MSIYVRIYANSNDGYSRSTSTTAIAGGITDNSGTTLKFGADVDDATCGQAFLAFDTSAIASPSTVSITLNQVVRSHAGTSGSSTYQPRYYNWTDPITTSTFRTNTQWTALTAAGTISLNLNDTPTSYSGSFNVLSGWNNATTSTKIALNTATNALTGAGWVAASADTSGTTDDPYLTAAPTGAWTFVGVSSLPTPGTTLTLTEPAGVADGDLLIACIASRSTATTAPTITGWTAVGSQNNNNTLTTGSAIASGAMLYRIRSGTPTLAVTIPSGISVAMGQIVAYRGSATTTPLDVSTAVTAGAGTAVSVTGLTTTQDDDLIVAMCAGGQEAAWSAFNNVTTPIGASGATDTTTAPSTTGWIERADNVTTTGADTSLGIFDAVRTGAGATGNLTVTASVSAGHVVIAGAFKMPLADAWNINDKSSNITLSAVDKTATTTSATSSGVRSTKSYLNGTAGKYYAEFLIGSMATTSVVGLLDTTVGVTLSNSGRCVTRPNEGNVYVNIALQLAIGAFTSGDVIAVAWNAGSEQVWFRKNAGNWNNSGSADPASDTGGVDFSVAATNNYALAAQFGAASNDVTIRTELAEYTQAVPTGFKSWMGETPPTADAWNKDDLALGTLSNNDKTLTSPSSGTASRSTTTHTNAVAGKYYAEAFTGTLASGQALFGIKNRSATITDITDAAYINAISGNTNVIAVGGPSLGAFAAGDIICVAWDAGAERIWFRKNAGNWNNNATYDPATGVGGISAATLTNAVAFGLWGSLGEGGYALTLRTEAAEFTQPTPTGFLSWMGESLTVSVTANLTGVGVTAEVGTLTVLEPVADAWNILDKTSGVALTNSDKTATMAGTPQAVRSTTANPQTGKYYAEFVANTEVGYASIGIVPAASPLSDEIYTTGLIVYASSGLYSESSYLGDLTAPVGIGDVICLAVDLPNAKGWLRRNGGLWNNSGTADPATNTDGFSWTPPAGNVELAVEGFSSVGTPVSVTIRTEFAEYAQTVPSGFKSWMGEVPATVASVSNPAALTVSAGDLSIAAKANASVSNPALLTVSAGDLSIAAKANASVSNPALLTVSAGDVSVAAKANASVANPAALTVSAGTLDVTAKRNVSASVANPAALTVDVGTLTVTTATVVNVTASVSNPAALAVSAGDLSVSISKIASLTNPALLTVSAGTLDITAKQNITASVSNPAALAVSAGTLTVSTAGNVTASVSNPALLTVSAGDLSIAAKAGASVANPALLTVSAGTLSVAAKAGASVANPALLTVSAGTLSVAANASASVSNPALLTASAGTVTVTAKENITASVSNPAALTVSVGTLSVAAGGSISVPLTGVEVIASAGTITITSHEDVTLTGVGVTVSVGTVTVETPAVVGGDVARVGAGFMLEMAHWMG